MNRIHLPTPVPGTEIVIDRSGDAQAPAFVWLHGEFGAIDDVPGRETLDAHADVIEVHLPGYGVAAGGERFDGIAELAHVVWWALEHLEVRRPVLAGHGLGATLAVEMAIQQPTAVEALALANPFGLFRVEDPGVDLFALMPRDLHPHLYADPGAELVNRHFPPPADAYERGLSAIRRVEVLGASSRYLFPIPDTNVTSRAYRLAAIPTTIWFGAADGVVPASLAADWADALPHADVRVVAGAAHMVPYEHPGFAAELCALLPAAASAT